MIPRCSSTRELRKVILEILSTLMKLLVKPFFFSRADYQPRYQRALCKQCRVQQFKASITERREEQIAQHVQCSQTLGIMQSSFEGCVEAFSASKIARDTLCQQYKLAGKDLVGKWPIPTR